MDIDDILTLTDDYCTACFVHDAALVDDGPVGVRLEEINGLLEFFGVERKGDISFCDTNGSPTILYNHATAEWSTGIQPS